MNKFFKRKEFACKCGCGFAVVDYELLEILVDVRTHFNKPVSITSACRCEAHNASVGGSKGSKHKLGIAADIIVSGVSPDEVHSYLTGKYPAMYGIGKYVSFTHIDVRPEKVRW